MDAIGVLGGAAKGFNDYHQQAVQESVINRENALKDYQIKEFAKKDAADKMMIPVEQFWPQYKDMPETFEAFKTAMNEQGLGDGFKDVGGIPMIQAYHGKQLMALMAQSSDMRMKINQSMQADFITQHNKLGQIVASGMDSQGNKLKPEQLDAYQKKYDALSKAIAATEQIKHASELQKERIKREYEARERKPYGSEEGTGRKVNVDKYGRYFYDDDTPVKDMTRVTPQSETNAGVARTSVVMHPNQEPKDNRTSLQKDWELLKDTPRWKGKTFADFYEWVKTVSRESPDDGYGVRRPTGKQIGR